MPDNRGQNSTGPAYPVPVQLPGNGPGRWNKESGSRPSTSTTKTGRKRRVTDS